MRPARAAALAIALLLTVTGCTSATANAVEQHADVAGNIMSRGRGPVPARALANAVTGQTSDTTIDALEARGSSWGGSVVLRITVRHEGFDLREPSQVVRCYKYHFAYPRARDQGVAHDVDCPKAARAIDEENPPLPDGVTGATRNRVLDVLDAMDPRSRDDRAAVRRAVTAAIGPDFYLESGRGHLVVRYADSCAFVDVSATEVWADQVKTGDDCYGG